MGDYCSVANLKAYLGQDAATDEALLADAIDAAEAYIDKATRRRFRVPKVSWRRFDAIRDVDGDTLYLDYDLVKDSQIVNGDNTIVAVADRQLMTPNSPPYWGIRLLSGRWTSRAHLSSRWTYSTHSEDAIRIRGYWGYSIKAPPDIVQATRRLAAYLYKQKDSQVFDVASFYEGGILTVPQGIPSGVALTLNHYRRGGVA